MLEDGFSSDASSTPVGLMSPALKGHTPTLRNPDTIVAGLIVCNQAALKSEEN